MVLDEKCLILFGGVGYVGTMEKQRQQLKASCA